MDQILQYHPIEILINQLKKTADPNGTQGATNSSNGDGENSPTAISGGTESDDVKKTSKDGDQETTIPSSTGEDNKTDGDPLRESPGCQRIH